MCTHSFRLIDAGEHSQWRGNCNACMGMSMHLVQGAHVGEHADVEGAGALHFKMSRRRFAVQQLSP